MHIPKRTQRQEFRLKQREQTDASPFLATKFPLLKSLKVTLEYYDAVENKKQGEMKCKLNLDHARSHMLFVCPGSECLGGDFDLSNAVADAVHAKRKTVVGEMRCHGTRKRGEREPAPCQTVLRYKMNLSYD